MQNSTNELTEALKSEQSFISDGCILKNKVIESALKLEPSLIELLLSSSKIKSHFFTEVAGVLVFDKTKFQEFVSSKAFLLIGINPSSVTNFKRTKVPSNIAIIAVLMAEMKENGIDFEEILNRATIK